MISRFERFAYNITEIDLYWHRLSTHVMKQYNLKGSYAVYFLHLLDKSEGVAAVDLAKFCNKDKADVSRDMADLEKRGIIIRQKNGNSGYRAKIFLTEEGIRIAREIVQITETAVSVVSGRLSEEEQGNLFHCLEEISEAMKSFCENGLPE